MNKKQKVILAFSGGLDTTFCVLHFIEKGYDVVTVTVNTGGFSKGELNEIQQKSADLGSIKHYAIDAEKKIYDQIIQHVIKLNSLYQDDYPVMCADRYVICQEILSIAKKEKTQIVAHGSTANGNDQVRFDAAFYALDPNFTILCPIKYLNITRDAEIDYIESRGFSVDKKVKKYSNNYNIFGSTISGSEIDENQAPDKEAYLLTRIDSGLTRDSSENISLEFKHGEVIALNNKKMSGLEILKALNTQIGRFGYGARLYTGDCIIGIKGHLLFEAPGLFALIEAHRKLEQYVLTKKQLKFNRMASEYWTDLVYSGLYFEPLVRNIEALSDSIQTQVSGKVTLNVTLNQIQAVQIESPHSLINPKVATYAQKGSWTHVEADGFVKLYSLQQTIANTRK